MDTLEHNLEIIRRTRRCRPEILDAAEKITDFDIADCDIADCEALSREFVANGEDTALGILMNICAVRQIKLDPNLLGDIFKVIEPVSDFGSLLRFQGVDVIPVLLSLAEDEALPYERQAYAVFLAAEMALVHGSDRQPVKRMLQIIEQTVAYSTPIAMMIATAQNMLEDNASQPDTNGFFTQMDILDLLPAEPPPVVIGEGQTVRRPVPKIGRNAPCHCGSKKKYKKCCMEKDQELIRDASSYEGLTRTQISLSPNLVDDAGMIEKMRAYELKKLDPALLNQTQLMAAYRRCDLFGLRALAFNMLKELQARSDNNDFDPGHFVDLTLSAMDAGDIDLAQEIYTHHPPPEFCPEHRSLKTQFKLLQQQPLLDDLEDQMRSELAQTDDLLTGSLLLRLSYGFEKSFPALSIAFARAYIAGNPDSFFDNELLISAVRRARAEIDMEAWDDPIEDYLEWCFQRDLEESEEKKTSQALQALNEKLATAKDSIRQGQREMQNKENELKELAARLKRQSSRTRPAGKRKQKVQNQSRTEDKDTIARLRSRVTFLKAEIGTQQKKRQDLRKELQQEQEKPRKHNLAAAGKVSNQESTSLLPPLKKSNKFLIPDFTPAFVRSCEGIPIPIRNKALKAAVGFTAGDEVIRRETKPIKRIVNCYRIRISRSYRLLLNWQADTELTILECIHRSGLEAWIRRHAK
jgi:hypothetical protein